MSPTLLWITTWGTSFLLEGPLVTSLVVDRRRPCAHLRHSFADIELRLLHTKTAHIALKGLVTEHGADILCIQSLDAAVVVQDAVL